MQPHSGKTGLRAASAPRRLAAALSLALGAGLLAHAAEVRAAPPVTNCADSGSGSLRASVAAAVSGETIDLSNLACSTITLTSGAIAIPQNALTMTGPGEHALTIDGDFNDRVFHHTGSSVLALYDLTVSDGKYVSDSTPYGGCIYSSGSAKLYRATISGCIVVGQETAVARGGGIQVAGSMLLDHSTITGNIAHGLNDGGAPYNVALGGGISVGGDFVAKYSTISDNEAIESDTNHNSSGGGIAAFGNFGLANSTVSGNSAVGMGGVLIEGGTGAEAHILDSTISENVAHIFSALYTQVPATIANSTIAFNRATSSVGRGAVYSQVAPIELQSTIIAGNERGTGGPDDLNGTGATVVTGANNLVTSSTIPVPPDTITDCPHLNPLADNGGPTRTNALRIDSPAMNHGNNAANLTTDQRGMPRVSGSAADIGAYERNAPDEHLLFSGFEGVCDR
ncbi:MAG TPA: choice-of-anchor Q domain-containing protein [Rhodanobacteraceae bacterium]|nr:choice-of-anchor Q domain-containing protein [Rhodanobacteraceae bacterium]